MFKLFIYFLFFYLPSTQNQLQFMSHKIVAKSVKIICSTNIIIRGWATRNRHVLYTVPGYYIYKPRDLKCIYNTIY